MALWDPAGTMPPNPAASLGPLSSHYTGGLAAPVSPMVLALQPHSYFFFLFPFLFPPFFAAGLAFGTPVSS